MLRTQLEFDFDEINGLYIIEHDNSKNPLFPSEVIDFHR